MKALRVVVMASIGLLPCAGLAEDNGEELLGLMAVDATREVAQMYVDAVWQHLDGVLFCLDPQDRPLKAFAAVKSYLERNPAEQYRPRRYLIIQGLREAYPCTGS